MSYQVFISYSRSNSAEGRALENEISNIDSVVVLRDKKFILPGDEIHQSILKMIDKADCVVALLTFEGLNSKEVSDEISRSHDRNKCIIPVVQEGIEKKDLLWYLWDIDLIKYNKRNFDEVVERIIKTIKKRRDDKINAPVGAETGVQKSIELPTYIRSKYSFKSNDFLNFNVKNIGSSSENLHWIDFVDSQLKAELQSISFGPDIQKSLLKHRDFLQKDLETLRFSMRPSVEEALTDLGRLQSISQSNLRSTFSRLRILCPISCLGAIAIFQDLADRRKLPLGLDLRFQDAISALDSIERCSEPLPDGLVVGIGPTLKPSFAKTMKEYLPVCIMPPVRQEFIYAGSQKKGGRNVFDDVKLKMHNRYTNLELHAEVFAQRRFIKFGRIISTEPNQALQELVKGIDTSVYGLWGLWATTAKRLFPHARTSSCPYFSDTLLTMHRRLLADIAPKVETLKDAIGESWIQLRNSFDIRRQTIASLFKNEDFRCQFSKFFIYPFMDV